MGVPLGPLTRQLYVPGARLPNVAVKLPLELVVSPVNSLSGPPDCSRSVRVIGNCCKALG